jgi:predicted negative regulator of RcsB-dependent stress response
MRLRILVLLLAVLPIAAWADSIDRRSSGFRGSPGEAERYLIDLRSQAIATGDHGLIMELDTQIAREQGLQGHFDQAKALLATVAADLKPDETGPRALYELELGRVIMTQGDSAGAVSHFQSALEEAKAAKRDALAVDAQVMLAVTDPDPAQQVAKGEIALHMATSSADPAARQWIASILNNIGAAYDDARQYDKALNAFQKSRAACATVACRRIAEWKIAHVQLELGKIAAAQTMLEALERQWAAVSDRRGPAFDLGDGKEYVYEELGNVHLALAQAKPNVANHERAVARAYFAKANAEMSKSGGPVAPSLVDQPLAARLKSLAQ